MTWILQFLGFLTPTFLLFFDYLELVIEMNVLVVIPLTSYEYNLQHRKKVVDAIRRNFLDCGDNIKYQIYYTASTLKNKEGVVHALNRVLDGHARFYDYVWIVESDIVVPVTGLAHLFMSDGVIAMGCAKPSYDHDNPEQSAIYKDLLMAGRFVDPHNPVHPFESVTLHRQDLEGKVLTNNVFAGLCSVLLHKKVIDSDLRFRWKDKPDKCGHDVYFFYQAQMNYKFKCVLNGNVICEHLR